MKIGIIGATGKLGTILVDILGKEGYSVTGIVRNKSKLPEGLDYIEKNIFDLTSDDLSPFDVVINTFAADPNNASDFITSTKHIISILKNGDTRLLFAGGAGILFVDEETILLDTPEMPEEFREFAIAEVEAYKFLEAEKSFDWTYMSPPAFLDYDAPYTGNYKFSGNKLGFNSDGQSVLSYKDYAEAFIEKIKEPENHVIVGVYS